MQDPMRIVLADADHAFRMQMQERLMQESDCFVVGDTDSGKVLMQKIDQWSADVLVMGLVLSDWDGYRVLAALHQTALLCIPRVLVQTTFPLQGVYQSVLDLGADMCVSKQGVLEKLPERLRALRRQKPILACETEDKVRDMAKRLLLEMDMPAKLNGFTYLQQAVCEVVIDPSLSHHMTDVLYPRLGRQFQTQHYCIERSMRHAIEVTWMHGNIEGLYRIFGNSIDPQRGKPTNSECIAMLAEHIRRMVQEGGKNR